MSSYRKTSARYAVALIVCVVLCCLVGVAAMFVGGISQKRNVPPPQSSGARSAVRYRDYTDIRAELCAPDVVFYNGFSTGDGIKQNLNVVGTYNGRQYALSTDEYYVTAEGLGEIDVLDFATNPETLTVTVCVPSGNRTLTAKTDITIEDSLPVFSAVTATGSASIADDYGSSNIKNELTVLGTVGDKNITVNRELYDIADFTLTAGSSATIALVFKNEVYSGPSIEVTFASVRAAEVTGIAVAASSDLKLDNGFYKKGEYSAFVDGMPFFADGTQASVFSSIDVRVFYENSSELAGFAGAGSSANVTLENKNYKNVIASASGSTSAGSNNISFTMTLANGKSFNDSITLPFESKTVVDIAPSYVEPATTVYSYTDISDVIDNVTVFPIYNDGSKGNTGIDFTYSGSLTPTSSQLNDHKGQTDWKYDKEIAVSYTTLTRNVLITNIEYKAADEISGTGKPAVIPQQTMTRDFDYTGFYVEASYNDGNDFANIMLSDISYDKTMPIYKEIEYRDKDRKTIVSPDNKVPKDAKSARITIYYGGSTNRINWFDFNLVQAPVDYPTASEFVKDFDEDCTITLSGINEYMIVSAADDITSAHVDIGEKDADGNVDLTFKAGGEFYVNVVIKGNVELTADGADGVYRFKDVIGESNIEKKDNYTVTYRFVINKGEFELSLEYGDKQDEWVYGGTPGTPVVKGVLGGRTYTIKNQETNDGLAYGEIGVPYLLYYYGFGGRTYDDIVGKTYDEIAALCSALPVDVGEYNVIVVTKETDAYAQSAAFRWNAHTVKITPKPLTLSVVKNAIYTRGTSYSANDVINTNSFAYSHGVADVLQVTAADAPFTHADSYDITITITNKNYKWDSGVTVDKENPAKTETQFVISKRELDFTVSVSGFTYGDTAINLNPAFKYQDTKNGAFVSAKGNFYAVVGAPVYYHATAAGEKTGASIDLSVEPMSKWSAGKYYAEYSTAVDSANGDAADDYTTPTAGCSFEVSRKKLALPTFTGVSGTYDSVSHDITINGYSGIVAALVNGESFDDVFTVTVTASDANGADISTTASRTGGAIAVTEAGDYKVDVAFNGTPNYEWTDGSVNAVESSVYTIGRKELAITDALDGGKEFVYTYDGSAHTPDPKLTGLSAHTVTIVTAIYEDEDCTKAVVASAVTQVGEYWIRVENYSVKDASSGAPVSQANYELPNITVFKFLIVAAGLSAPELKDASLGDAVVSDIYKGVEFKISDYIKNWSALQYGVETAVYGNNAAATLKDVLYADGGVTAYKVYIYPKTNYDWVDGVITVALPSDPTVKAYVIDFTITRLEVELEWSAESLETAFNDAAQSPTVEITNKGGDDLTAVIGFKQNSTETTARDAGVYTAYIKSLDGDDSGNYKVSTTNSAYSVEYTIYKKVIARPVLPTGEDDAFNGASGSKTVEAAGYEWSEYVGVVSVTASGVVPSRWLGSDLAMASDVSSFNVGSGQFTYTRAGDYTFTVSLDLYRNYCFDQDQKADFDRNTAYTYVASDKFTVNRKALVAPDFHEKRAQEWSSATAIDFGTAADGVAYIVKYGKYGGEPTSDSWLGGGKTDSERGIYFAELKLNDGKALNYVWVENTVDTGAANNKLDYVNNTYANYYYSADKVAIRLYYAITSSQIDVSVVVDGYIFGDNGIVDGIVGAVKYPSELSANSTTVRLEGNDVGLAVGANIAKLADVSFVDESGNELSTDDLVNGLPWDAGKYRLKGKLTFGDGNTYQAKDISVEFTVSRREISVTWSDLIHEYDATSHMASAVINTVVKKTDSDTADYTAGLVLTVTQTNGDPDPINVNFHMDGKEIVVDGYSVKVAAIDAADGVKNNFKLPSDALTATLTITRKTVYVNGADVSDHVYGDEITAAEKKWAHSDSERQFCNDGAANFVEVKIVDGDNNEIDKTAKTGAYFVGAGWAENAGVHTVNYDAVFANGNFAVVARTLTVELNSANATGRYGDAVDLYDATKPIYNVTACNGKDDDMLGGLSASDVFVFTSGASSTAATGSYDITASAKDEDNFVITFVGEWKYIITNAAIDDNGTIVGIDDTTYGAADINVLKSGFAVTTQNAATAKWEYAFVSSASVEASAVTDWTEFTDSPTVYDAGDYCLYIRVTAANHDPLVKQIEVKVDKAELTVAVDLEIMFGEADPTTVAYKMSIADLRSADGIYTVDGLIGADRELFYSNGGFYNLVGDVKYTVDNFTGAVDTYDLTFTAKKNGADALVCDNYTFAAAGGTLTVSKIKLIVTIDDAQTVYNAQSPDTPSANVQLPKSTYDVDADLILPDSDYRDIFGLSSAAVTNGEPTTAGVGKYPVVGTNNKPERYDITFAGSWSDSGEYKGKAGTYTVTPAALTLSVITGGEISYDERYHGPTVKDGDGNATETLATTADGSPVTAVWYKSEVPVTIFSDENLSKLENCGATMPVDYIDVGTYYIVYKISAANHTAQAACVKLIITKASNDFITRFGFACGMEFDSGIEGIPDTSAAWVYGLYGDGALNGYNADGGQKVTEPEAKFTRAVGGGKNALTFDLLYSDEFDKSYQNFKEVLTGKASAAQIFADGFNAGLFKAGYYILRVKMSGTVNYEELNRIWLFKVARRDLTVSVEDISVMYGDPVTAGMYVGSYVGLVKNSTAQHATVDGIADAIGGAPSVSTDYAVGKETGEYTVTVSGGLSDNYNVTYNNAKIRVIPREVTVKIEDKRNTYNLQNNETAETLTFAIVGSKKFYNVEEPTLGKYDNVNQSIIELRTDAIPTGGSGIKTNDVIDGGYAIYAVYASEFAKKNYVIKFAECAMTETRDGAITDDGKPNAGRYLITPATFSIESLGVYHLVGGVEVKSNYYSGVQNYYKAQFVDNPEIEISFTYSLQSQPDNKFGSEGVVNVGKYKAHAKTENPNYTAGTVSFEFEIRKTTVTLTAVETTIQYGTPVPAVAAANDRFGGFSYTAHSKMSENDELAEKLTPETLDNYLDGKVEFKLPNYTAKTPAGAVYTTIEPIRDSDNNIEIKTVPAKLNVLRRTVTVTVVGYDIANAGDDTAHNAAASCYYYGVQSLTQNRLNELFAANIGKFIKTDVAETFGASGDALADLGVKLSLPANAIDVKAEGYGLTVESNASNYDIGFVTHKTADGVRQNRIEYTAADAPIFMIEKAPLTLYANVKSGNAAAAYSVVYGSAIELEYVSGGTLNYAIDGMQNGEQFYEILIKNGGKLVYTIDFGGKPYEAWKSGTNETYTVCISVVPSSGDGEVLFQNYKITQNVTARLNITKRTIEATTVDQIFEKAADGYHGGVYGKSHEAVITFAGVTDVAATAENINKNYRPSGYTLTYDTKTIGNYQIAGRAPTVVGDYHVTVKLAANGDYMFAGGSLSATLPFKVTKRIISDADLVWARTHISTDTENAFENTIANYVDDIMTISSFMFKAQYGGGKPIDQGTSGSEYYTFDEDGRLIVYFGAAPGTYEVNFSLKNTATGNYEFQSRNGTVVISAFAVSSDKVEMTLTVADFTYRDTPSTPVVTINGSLVTIGLVFSYGKVTDTSNIADYINKGDGFGGFDYDDLAGLKFDTLKAVSAFDAGCYVLYAQHLESSQSKYFVFRVNRKDVSAPAVTGVAPDTYNGQTQQLSFEYDPATVRASYAGSSVQSVNGASFFAKDADGYTISFRLVDPDNYKWADGVTGVNDGVWSYTWNIAKDTAEDDAENPYISMPDLTVLVFGQAFSRSTATVRIGYEGNIVYYYMSKSLSSAQPSKDDAGWLRALPSDADRYWIKAVVSDGNKNFTDKATVGSLEITAKEITATAYGSVIYGDGWNENNFRYTVDGLLYGDRVTESAGFKAILADNYGKLNAGGEYYVILDHDANGVVLGLSAGSNYVIKAVRGALTVSKRDVTVTIDSVSGYYTVEPNVGDVGYTVTNLAAGDDRSTLGIVLTTDATSDSDAGGLYFITAASYDDSNYNVTNFNRGVYTVLRLEISVELTAQTGLIYGDSGIVGATMGAITSDVENADIEKVRGDLRLSFAYTGRTFGGAAYADTIAPTEAGEYIATLVGVNDNYILIGSPNVEFTIAKKEVDVSAMSIASRPYCGEAIAPTVTDNVNGSNIYTVSDRTFTDAGEYDVIFTLDDADNYRWSVTDDAETSLVFVITKINDTQGNPLTIRGWQYGCYDAAINSPSATVGSGEDIVYQYSADGVNYSALVPANGNAGTYYVRVFVAESRNYLAFTGEPVRFEISRYIVTSPSLTLVSGGEGKNDVYTGGDLSSAIVGFDARNMQIAYDGRIQVVGNNVTVYAHDANVYRVYVSLFDNGNYCWNDGDADDDGTLVLEWTVARKKINKPIGDDSTRMVNGGTIVYIPVGFDPSVMTISNNAYSYGGTFAAEIRLIDTTNYEWADGGDQSIFIEWSIVGADPVFAAVISVLCVLAAVGIAFAIAQPLIYKRKKRMTAAAMSQIETGEIAAHTEASNDQSGEIAEQAERPEQTEKAEWDGATADEEQGGAE